MKKKLSDIILGIDLGGTIHHRVEGVVMPMPHAFRVIRDLKRLVKGIYIISKVTDEQSLAAYNWFRTVNFFEETTLTPNKVLFCYERIDKGPIACKLGVTHFIDDRPDVMLGLQSEVIKYLMNPSQSDMDKFQEKTKEMNIIRDWLTLENLILTHE